MVTIEWLMLILKTNVFLIKIDLIWLLILFQRRITRIQQIEKDILRIRQLLQSQATEAEVSELSLLFADIMIGGCSKERKYV